MTIDALYDKAIEKASVLCAKAKFNQSIHWAKFAANILYFSFKTLYEQRIENIISSISDRVGRNIAKTVDLQDNRVVFYDSFSYDNRGLTHQYTRALVALGFQVLYVSENTKLRSTTIYRELSSYRNVEFYIVPSNSSYMQRAVMIYDKIMAYGASRVFLHIKPSALECLIAMRSLPHEIIKYNINITDHAYWAGASIVDYNIEFRHYGASISFNYRHLTKSQLLLLPYYPLVDDVPFQGFPFDTDGKVILFFGGNLYKINAQHNFFLNVIKDVLSSYKQTVCVCAGKGDEDNLLSFIAENQLEHKLIYIGFREDIYQVVKHCDIFINTYPIGGGLMAQYAAINKKPIVAFTTRKGRDVETVIHTNKVISVDSRETFLDYIGHLITDKNYRISEGESLGSNIPSPSKFNEQLARTIQIDKTQYEIHFDDVSVTNLSQKDLLQIDAFKVALLKGLGLRAFVYFPFLFSWFIRFIFHKFLR